MRQIEISDDVYQTLTKHHGDIPALLKKLAEQAGEVAAVQDGIDAYNAGDCRPLEEFGRELQDKYGLDLPGT